MSAQRLVAGVDSSTQSCKVVVVDADSGEMVREARAAHPEGSEVCAEHWWAAFQQATADGLLEGVRAIAVAGQQHGAVTLDAEDRLVRDALLWNDTRSAGAAADLVSELGGPSAWAEAVGSVPVASFTVTKLRWLAEHEPDHADRTKSVVLPHDWLSGRILQEGQGFTGWTTDRGDASGTGYWSSATDGYRDDVLQLAFGRAVEVPRVLAPDEAAGQTKDGVLVAAGTGDNMGAALGLGVHAGDVIVSLGTSGAVFAEYVGMTTDSKGFVAGFASASGGGLPLACTINAARVLGAGAAQLGVSLDEFDALALAAPAGAEGLTLLPYLDGERTPNLPSATGTLSGLTRSNWTPANLARATVEGMLLNLSWSVNALQDNGIDVHRVVLIGGAAASRSVREVARQVFGVPIVIPAPGEYVARGAARQAAWALTPASGLPQWPVAMTHTLEPVHSDGFAEAADRYNSSVQRQIEFA